MCALFGLLKRKKCILILKGKSVFTVQAITKDSGEINNFNTEDVNIRNESEKIYRNDLPFHQISIDTA